MPKDTMQRKAAGRVLSAENERLLREARDNLDSVLSKIAEEDPVESAAQARANRMALKPGSVRVNADASGTEAEVLIYGDIGYGWYDEGITAETITNTIAELDVETINVRINSGGGLVFEGLAIYQAFARHDAKIVVHIDGIAASIASIIAMAGDEIRISEGANLMIHKPWSGVWGDAVAMRKEADVLDQLEKGLINIYEARTGAKRSDIESWVGAETWFLGQEAVDAGFADVIVPAKKKPANSALFNLFKRTPQNLLASSSTPEIREFESFLRDAEGLSNAQAKRIAAAMPRSRRDDSTAPQVNPLRDVGESAEEANRDVAKRLAQSINQLTSTLKE